MDRKKLLFSWPICSLLILLVCFPVWADGKSSGGGAVPKGNGDTDIMAGVVVDYMGKMRFLVLDIESNNPLESVSVEIFIPSLNRYVLFGMTDSSGIYELEVVNSTALSAPESEQFIKDGDNYISNGMLVYLSSNRVRYRVYKAGWNPYPRSGRYTLKGGKEPETVTIYLYQRNGNDSDDDDAGSKKVVPGEGSIPLEELPSEIPDKIPPLSHSEGTSGIPKTGVEGALYYWALGLIFFLLAGGAIWKLSRPDTKSKETKRREQNDKT